MNKKRFVILSVVLSLTFITAIFTLHRHPFTFYSHNETPTEMTAEESSPPSDAIPAADIVEKPDAANVNMTKFPEAGLPVLMYHSISTIPNNSLGVPVEQFSEEIRWLRQHNYHSLSLEQFYQAIAHQAPVPENPILLTFDDGYADNYLAAWPILKQNGFTATFFIITNSVGPGMMTWDQLSDLVRQGNSIGSHTIHHFDLATLSYQQQETELAGSKQIIENHLAISEMALCFPSGKYNKTTLSLMPKVGYQLGFTTQPGKVHLGDDLLTLKRIRIPGGMPFSTFQQLFP